MYARAYLESVGLWEVLRDRTVPTRSASAALATVEAGVVDAAIVVLENIQRYRDEGVPALEAARRGTSEVGRAVIAATLTTVCVFVPIVFVEGVAGQLFRDQALTVTFSLVASLIVALMLLPMLASLTAGRQIEGDEAISGGEGDPGLLTRGASSLLRGLAAIFGGLGRLLGLLISPLELTHCFEG